MTSLDAGTNFKLNLLVYYYYYERFNKDNVKKINFKVFNGEQFRKIISNLLIFLK